MCDRFLSVFSLVSRIPLPVKFKFDCSRMDFYLPVAGVFSSIITFACAALFYFLVQNTLLAVVCALLSQYLCFNLFHLDGLVDTADAFLGTVAKDKTLAILKDSRAGSYGLFAGTISIVLKITLVYILFSTVLINRAAGLCLFFAWPVSGRFAAAIIPAVSPPAQKGGLGFLAKDSSLWRGIAGCILSCVVLLLFAYLFDMFRQNVFLYQSFAALAVLVAPFILITFISAFTSALFYTFIYKKRLGGYTGDALGAAIESGEILFLFLIIVMIRFFGNTVGLVLC
jgi:adenosylcobinamide-GDP ribazoletransferase